MQEYANACGETMSNLVRKVMIRHITFMDGFKDYDECRIEISVPRNATSDEETLVTQNTYNKVRGILDFEEIQL